MSAKASLLTAPLEMIAGFFAKKASTMNAPSLSAVRGEMGVTTSHGGGTMGVSTKAGGIPLAAIDSGRPFQQQSMNRGGTLGAEDQHLSKKPFEKQVHAVKGSRSPGQGSAQDFGRTLNEEQQKEMDIFQ